MVMIFTINLVTCSADSTMTHRDMASRTLEEFMHKMFAVTY